MILAVSTHTNIHQNRSINECARILFGHKSSLRPWMTFEVTSNFIKKMCLYNVGILEKLNKKYIAEENHFEI